MYSLPDEEPKVAKLSTQEDGCDQDAWSIGGPPLSSGAGAGAWASGNCFFAPFVVRWTVGGGGNKPGLRFVANGSPGKWRGPGGKGVSTDALVGKVGT